MEYSTIKAEVDDKGICVVRLNRPDNRNAFTVSMADELVDFYRSANANDDIKAIVLTGSGKYFCAGMDLSAEGNVFGLDESLAPTMADMHQRIDDPEIVAGVRDTGGQVTLAMYDCLKPIVAAINGDAVGIGATMTLAADFRLASTEARFGFVFGKIGITPEACSTWFLPRIVGLEQALEWTYRANVFPASEALEKGLVRQLHAPADLLAEAMGFAQSLVQDRSAVSLALTRQMMYRNSAQPSPMEAHRVESLAIFYAMAEAREGIAAFLEKRRPNFTSLASKMPDFFPWE